MSNFTIPRWHQFHPILWAAQPLFFLYARSVHETRLVDILAPLGVSLAGAAFVWGLAYFVLRRDGAKAACLSTVVVILVFSFGGVVSLADRFFAATGLWRNLTRMQSATRTVSLQTVVLTIFFVLLIGVLIRLSLRKPLPAWVSPLLGRTAALLLLLSFVQVAVAFVQAPERRIQGVDAAAVSSNIEPASGRDVYIIIVDAYARQDILRQDYGFDNSPFLDALRQMDFAVPERASANYPWTFLSLSSTLNMRHLEDLVEEVGIRSRDQKRAQEMIRDNATVRFFKSRGYRTIHFASSWAGTRTNPNADETIRGRRHIMDKEFARALIDSTLVGLFNARLVRDLAEFHLEQLDNLESMGGKAGPKLVFAHILLPHHPYLFDRTGRIVQNSSFIDNLLFRKAQWRQVDAYTDQLTFLNDRLLAIFKRLIGDSRVPPVIVLFSDHGPVATQTDRPEARLAQLANLTAAYLPGAPADLLPDDIRLVNLLPTVLNFYFDAGFEMQSPARFFSTYEQPYRLEAVPPDPRPEGQGK